MKIKSLCTHLGQRNPIVWLLTPMNIYVWHGGDFLQKLYRILCHSNWNKCGAELDNPTKENWHS